MAAISAFPDLLGQVIQGVYGDDVTFTADGAILAGQIVTTGSSTGEVKVAPADNSALPLGVAIADAADGQLVSIRVTGIAYVANGDDTTAIAQGVIVKVGTFAGAVVTSATYGAASGFVAGITLDAIAASGTGRIVIGPAYAPKAAAET